MPNCQYFFKNIYIPFYKFHHIILTKELRVNVEWKNIDKSQTSLQVIVHICYKKYVQ